MINEEKSASAETSDSKKCFVISPIGEVGGTVRKHADMTLNAIIKPAIKECGIKFDVKRADDSAEIGMITDHIIADILDSDLVIADLSFLNPNVFYELGIAHAVEKPVIHIAHRETKLPFDNIGYRAVMFDPTDWHSQIDARQQISESTKSAMRENRSISNPITHARGWKKLKKSTKSEENMIARLIEENSEIKNILSLLQTDIAMERTKNLDIEKRSALVKVLLGAERAKSVIGADGAFSVTKDGETTTHFPNPKA